MSNSRMRNTQKKVQMHHAVAQKLVRMFNEKGLDSFGKVFPYKEVLSSWVDGHPATLEGFIDGQALSM